MNLSITFYMYIMHCKFIVLYLPAISLHISSIIKSLYISYFTSTHRFAKTVHLLINKLTVDSGKVQVRHA